MENEKSGKGNEDLALLATLGLIPLPLHIWWKKTTTGRGARICDHTVRGSMPCRMIGPAALWIFVANSSGVIG